MEYGQIVTGSNASAVLQSAGIGPNDVVGDFFDFSYNGNLYWILQRDIYFAPKPGGASVDGWHIVYRPSQEEISAGAPGPDFWDRIEAALAALAAAAQKGGETLSTIVPIVLIGLAGIALFSAYSWSKK